MCVFISPSSHAFRRISSGHVPSRSYSQATGRISFSAKSCAISRSALCSSVSVKSTIGFSGSQIDWSVNSYGKGTYPVGQQQELWPFGRVGLETSTAALREAWARILSGYAPLGLLGSAMRDLSAPRELVHWR